MTAATSGQALGPGFRGFTEITVGPKCRLEERNAFCLSFQTDKGPIALRLPLFRSLSRCHGDADASRAGSSWHVADGGGREPAEEPRL